MNEGDRQRELVLCFWNRYISEVEPLVFEPFPLPFLHPLLDNVVWQAKQLSEVLVAKDELHMLKDKKQVGVLCKRNRSVILI